MHSFTLERRKIIVTATLKGPNDMYNYRFILDTGAGSSIIDESVAISLGYHLYNIPKSETFITAGGRINARLVNLHKLTLFDKTIPNFKVGVVRLPMQILVDGLIGMDFLQNFQRLQIHFDRQEIEAE